MAACRPSAGPPPKAVSRDIFSSCPSSVRGELDLLHPLALRIYLHSHFTPCVDPSHSRVEALRYQLDFVNLALRRLLEEGAIRLMLADDVGLGKTVMTGLLLKELKLRGLAKRFLIMVPKMLKFQWRRELEEKFGIRCLEAGRGIPDADCVVASIDYFKRHVDEFLRVPWDFAVVDEAHNLTVPKGRRPTQRYAAVERLAAKVRNLLLLTATPHHGDRADFIARLRLLDRSVDDYTIRDAVSRLVVKRFREDVRDEAGIPDRQAYTVPLKLADREARFYAALTEYVKYYFDMARRASGRRRYALSLVAVVFQKRASSSLYAAVRTVERRIASLQRILQGQETPTDAPRSELEAIRRVVASREAIQEEIHRLRALLHILGISSADDLLGQDDSKLQRVRQLLEEHFAAGHKAIVFTQYRDTLRYLAARLAPHRPAVLHGGMDEEEKRRAEKALAETTALLIATDAASEGLNLQAANVAINYDLPWNPSRLDQRAGRVHRFGQRRPVHIYNILLEDTIDGRVYHVLAEKLREVGIAFERAFDYLGLYIREADFRRLVEAATRGTLERAAERAIKSKAGLRDIQDLLTQDRIKLEHDPRCDDVVTAGQLEALVLHTLAAMDPRSYQEKDGCIKVTYLPTPLRRHCEGTCTTGWASFGGRCQEHITVEHPLVQAILRHYLDSWPQYAEAEVGRPAYADGWIWVVQAHTRLRIPVTLEGDTQEYPLTQVEAYYVPAGGGPPQKVPLSILDTITHIRHPHSDPPEVPGEIRAELEEALRQKAERLAEIVRSQIQSDQAARMKELAKKRAVDPALKASERRRLINAAAQAVGQIDAALQALDIELKPLAIIKTYPTGYLLLGMDWATRLIEQGQQGEKAVIENAKGEGCQVWDLRDKPAAGIDLILLCPDEIKLVEVKTVKGPHGEIHITPVEWATLCANKGELARMRDVREATTRRAQLKASIYLYVVDLANHVIQIYRNPCDLLKNHIQQYRVEQVKYQIPYRDLLKIAQPTQTIPL